jgi:hypothetical protein
MRLPCGILAAMHAYTVPWHLIFLVAFKLLKTFGLIPGAIGAVWLRKQFQKRRQQRAMEGWPSTEASILWGKVQREGPRQIWAEVTYSYFVGEYRTGTHLRHFRREEDADEFVRQIKDKRIQIRYKESDPETSTILDRDLDMIAPMALQIG